MKTARGGFLALVITSILGSTARAADSDSSPIRGLEEVIVTAQKREQASLDVPMSISAISGERLAAAGIDNTLDLSFAAPSLSVWETGPGRQVIVIRGIGSIRGSSSLTGVYLDEMPVTGAQDGFIQAFPDLRTIDLERVEVLKGPQGTLFGEGAAGGVIRYITADPDLSGAAGSLSTELYSTTDGGWSQEVTGVANVPLSDAFGMRAAAAYENKAGWIDQPSIGRENINDNEVWHLRLKALYAPSDALRIKSTAEIHRNEGGASNIVNQRPYGASNFLQAFDRGAPTGYRDDYDLFNLAVTYDLGSAQLLSSTSYAKLDSRQSFTQLLGEASRPSLEILIRELPQDASIASQEVRLTSKQAGPFNWSIGGTYKDAELRAGFGEPGVDAVLGGGATVISGLLAGTKPVTKSKSWAAFANGSYELANRVELGGGLRYFNDEREAFDSSTPEVGALSDTFDQVTYRAYAKYKYSSAVNFYLNVASGFRSGGFNDPSQIPRGSPASYAPEKTIFYETGTKMMLLGGRMRMDFALFFGEFNGMQEANNIPSPVDGAPVQFTTNSQDAELRGGEWDISWLATDALTLTFAGDVTDSEITWIDPRNLTPAFQLGDPINFVPEYSVSLSADWRFQWTPSVAGFLLLSASQKGESFQSDRSNALVEEPQGRADEVRFLNISVGAQWNEWRLSLFGRNLLDEDNPVNACITGCGAQVRRRTLGVTVGRDF